MTMSKQRRSTHAPAPKTADQPNSASPERFTRASIIKTTGFLGSMLAALIVYLIMPDDLANAARITAAVGILMGGWWITEAVPLPVTALLPVVLFPALGVAEFADLGAHYAGSIIFLVLGGFLLAAAMQRWDLHKRIALSIVLVIGTRPDRIVAGFMLATAFLSMWVSNTATAMMMIPMGLSVVALVEKQTKLAKKSRFGTGLMLSIAYGATLGGFATPIGSPATAIIVGYVRESLGYPLTFFAWMSIGVPIMLLMLVIGWIIITKFLWRPETKELAGGTELFRAEREKLGPMSNGERWVAILFSGAAICWVFLPLIFEDPMVTDTGIAMIAGLATFLLPVNIRSRKTVMDWTETRDLPWGVLILVGGGLALSSQILDSGLAEWMGVSLTGLSGIPTWAMLLVVVALILALTEFTSSTATAAAFVPMIGSLALAAGENPVVFAVAAGLACTLAFMLPVGTPPNAVAFGTGAVTIPQMMRTGIWMNVVSIAVVTVAALTLVPLVIGVS